MTMKFIAVFGPTRGSIDEIYQLVSKELDKEPRPFVIVTSTCTGWDSAGRRYADTHADVFKLVIKANMSLGREGVRQCNERMADIVDRGITTINFRTQGTLDMIRALNERKKLVKYLGLIDMGTERRLNDTERTVITDVNKELPMTTSSWELKKNRVNDDD